MLYDLCAFGVSNSVERKKFDFLFTIVGNTEQYQYQTSPVKKINKQ
jgi:hypothetical protein